MGIMKIEPVGSYAVRIYFDDLHQAGIYTWDFLHDLGIHKVKTNTCCLQNVALALTFANKSR